jgi:hypothetical protein
MKRCPSCNALLDPPKMTPAQLVASLKLVQKSRPPIFWWPDEELQRLEAFLQPGDVIACFYAFSVEVLRASGETVEFARHDNGHNGNGRAAQ